MEFAQLCLSRKSAYLEIFSGFYYFDLTVEVKGLSTKPVVQTVKQHTVGKIEKKNSRSIITTMMSEPTLDYATP